MQAKIVQKQGYSFETDIRGHRFPLDIPKTQQGGDTGPTPKEWLLASIGGCSAMDVVAFLGKHKIAYDSIAVTANADTTTTQPKVFTSVNVTYEIGAKDPNIEKIIEAVRQSMTLYCGVSAMIAVSCPIFYTVLINGEIEARDQADFTRK